MWWGNQVPVCFSFSYLINRHLDIEEQSEPQVNERTLMVIDKDKKSLIL